MTVEQVFIHNRKSLFLPSPTTTISCYLHGSAALFMFGERKERHPENIPLLRRSLGAPVCSRDCLSAAGLLLPRPLLALCPAEQVQIIPS